MIKKAGFIIFLLSTGFLVSQAQEWTGDIYVGTSNYTGDLLEKRYTMSNSQLVVGLGAGYRFTDQISVRGLLSFGKITADDKDNSDHFLLARNLNFFTSITELSVTGHYDFLNLNYHRVTPYVFGGIAIFRYNPYTYDTLGNKVNLKPLSTEGQGLSQYPTQKPYQLTQLCLPFGGGAKYAVSDAFSVGIEFSQRKSFTDYIDDVSTHFFDGNI